MVSPRSVATPIASSRIEASRSSFDLEDRIVLEAEQITTTRWLELAPIARGLSRIARRRDEAAALWERAIETDGRFGDAVYNLACAHALAGRLDQATDTLRVAIGIDPIRYVRLARRDKDLEPLKKRDDVRALLGVVR